MLPDSTIRIINDQIENEMKHLNSIFCSTHEDKMETLERIEKLQSMLNPSKPLTLEKKEDDDATIDLTPLFEGVANRLRKFRHK